MFFSWTKLFFVLSPYRCHPVLIKESSEGWVLLPIEGTVSSQLPSASTSAVLHCLQHLGRASGAVCQPDAGCWACGGKCCHPRELRVRVQRWHCQPQGSKQSEVGITGPRCPQFPVRAGRGHCHLPGPPELPWLLVGWDWFEELPGLLSG